MTDIKMPPMPEPDHYAFVDGGQGIWVEGGPTGTPFYSEQQVQELMREAVRLNAQAVPDWVPVTQQLFNSQEPWLYKTCWLAFPSGAVLTGVYEWRQGRNPDRFISNEIGDVWAFDVSHVMPVTPPPHPAMLSAAPAAPPQPTSKHRPDRQWYARMIQETLDDDFAIGPAFDAKAVPEISTEHGPWVESNIHEGETYCKCCLVRSVFAGCKKCEPHIVSAPAAPQPAQQDDDESDALTVAYLHGHGKGKDSVQPLLAEKDALLRQALDVLEAYSKSGYVRHEHPKKYAAGDAVAGAIRNHLGVEP